MTYPTKQAQTELRAADADRERAIAALKRHYVAGRLAAAELGDRIADALAARTNHDLNTLLADLPALPEAPVTTAPPAFAPSSSARAISTHFRAQGLPPHVAGYAAVMLLLLTVWLVTTPGGYFWPIWPLLGWGVGLVKHARCGTARAGRAVARSLE